ncbi:MAG: hypothetical protein KGR18_12120 [Acidobacteria bacterium]|nr:hypothetical protein [Acidobacteriota bacterium]
MDDEFDALSSAQADLEKPSRPIGADQHDKVIESEGSDRMLMGVEDVLIGDAVLPCALEDDRVHMIKLS